MAADFELASGKIVIVGDTRPRDYFEFFLEDSRKVAGEVFAAAARERPVAVVHCGDIAVYGSALAFWQGWTAYDRDVKPLTDARIPIFPAIGNHEYRGFTRSPLRYYFARFPHLAGKRWYTLRTGSALFVILDSNFKRLGASIAAEQDRWLDDVLAGAAGDDAIDLVLPVVHHPPFTNIARRYLVTESAAVQRRFVPRFVASGKVAAVFSGHVHTYERFMIDGIVYVVTGGAGSPRFHVRSTGRAVREDAYVTRETLRPFHYLRLLPAVAGSPATVEVVALDGDRWSVIDTFTLLARNERLTA